MAVDKETRQRLRQYGARMVKGRWGGAVVLAADAAGTGSPEVKYELSPEGQLIRNGETQTWDEMYRHLQIDGPVGIWLRARGVRPAAPPPAVVTTIRAPADWLAELDGWAERNGLTRTAAMLILTRVGRRVLDGALDRLQLSREEWERLIADE